MGKLTDDELKRNLHYDPLTGDFTWLVSSANRVKIGDIAGNNSGGYIRIVINSKAYKAHRLAWLYTHGYFPENEIDHINRIKDDNRIINLREVSRQCNIRNRDTQINNTSGIVGVYWNKSTNKWYSRIMVNSKHINLGTFKSKSKSKAAKARWDAEVKYNFPTCNTTSSAYKYLKDKGLI